MSKLKELEKRLKDEPDNLGLRVTVATALREAGRHDEAVELYRSVAIAYRDQGRNQQAIAVCRSILEIAPDDVRCHALLASLVAHHKGRAVRDTAQVLDEIVLEVGTPPPAEQDVPPPPIPREPAAVPPLTSARNLTPPPSGTQPPATHAAGSPTDMPAGSQAAPVPAAPRLPAATATPVTGAARVARAPTTPPAVARAGVSVPFPTRDTPQRDTPKRRSSLDETPLPVPMPYHVADPTTRSLKKLSEVDLRTPDPDAVVTPDPDDLPVVEGAKTRPGSDDGTMPGVKGIANAARRISKSLIDPAALEDLASELDTRQRPRIDSDELDRITLPPPTVPVELVVEEESDTGTPSITRDMRAPSNPPPPPVDDDTEEEDEGIPTLSDEDQDEPTRPRDTPLDVIIRTEAEGPYGTLFFQPLPPEHRDAVLARFHTKRVKKGTVVIRQGEVGHSLVVIVRGQLEARVERAKAPAIELGAIATGEFVGEGSLLARTPSPVHVVASIDSELLLLPPRDFYEIAGAFPALWAELKDVAERRKRELEAHLKR